MNRLKLMKKLKKLESRVSSIFTNEGEKLGRGKIIYRFESDHFNFGEYKIPLNRIYNMDGDFCGNGGLVFVRPGKYLSGEVGK